MRLVGLVLAAVVVASLSVVVASAAGLRVSSVSVRQAWTVEHTPPATDPVDGVPVSDAGAPTPPPAPAGDLDPRWSPTEAPGALVPAP